MPPVKAPAAEPATEIDRLNFTMTFGKYRDLPVWKVLDENPGYLVWAHTTVDRFKLSERLLKFARAGALIEAEKRHEAALRTSETEDDGEWSYDHSHDFEDEWDNPF